MYNTRFQKFENLIFKRKERIDACRGGKTNRMLRWGYKQHYKDNFRGNNENSQQPMFGLEDVFKKTMNRLIKHVGRETILKLRHVIVVQKFPPKSKILGTPLIKPRQLATAIQAGVPVDLNSCGI